MVNSSFLSGAWIKQLSLFYSSNTNWLSYSVKILQVQFIVK